MLSWRFRKNTIAKAERELNAARGMYQGSVELLEGIRRDLHAIKIKDTNTQNAQNGLRLSESPISDNGSGHDLR